MRKVLPVTAGLIVFGAHVAGYVLFPQSNASEWGNVIPSFSDSMQTYIACGAYWLGASYAMSAAFTAHALLIFVITSYSIHYTKLYELITTNYSVTR